MKNPHQYGGNIELIALAECLNINIAVFADKTMHIIQDKPGLKHYFLYLHAEHYVPLYEKGIIPKTNLNKKVEPRSTNEQQGKELKPHATSPKRQPKHKPMESPKTEKVMEPEKSYDGYLRAKEIIKIQGWKEATGLGKNGTEMLYTITPRMERMAGDKTGIWAIRSKLGSKTNEQNKLINWV
jgi:hypothetical protein